MKLNINDSDPAEFFLCPQFTCRNVALGAKDNATFIITDDLNVIPNSSGAIFRLLTSRGIDDIRSVYHLTMNVATEKGFYLKFSKFAISYLAIIIIFSETRVSRALFK